MDRTSVLRGLLCASCVCGASALATGQDQQFRSRTDTVPIFATVVDAGGQLVTDLTRDDFDVLDNGRRQSLTSFANVTQPITVVMMLDRSGSVEGQFALVERAAGEFVDLLGADDRARIGSFSAKVQIDPEAFTADHDSLLAILRNNLQPFGPTPLWNATAAAMTAVGGETGRRVVLVFTDGKDLPVDEGPDVTFDQIRTRAQTEDVMIYAIGLTGECVPAPASFVVAQPTGAASIVAYQSRGGGQGRGGVGQGRGRGGPIRIPIGGRGRGGRAPVPARPRPPGIPGGPAFPPTRPPTIFDPGRSKETTNGCAGSKPDPNLRALTAIGGGGYFELRQSADLAATFARIADELHHQYLLAFVPPERDGQLHRLEIRAKRSGVIVRARTGYVAPR